MLVDIMLVIHIYTSFFKIEFSIHIIPTSPINHHTV
jgi:hypothetical protein